jgi:predicted regulator of Ras-like GTPase activity (Roadblock/LC7/MglB family)
MSDELRVDSGALIFATLADVYISSGMIDEAISILKDGLARNPNYHLAKIILGRAHFLKGEVDTAIEIIEAVYDEVKESESANLYLGHCYRKLGDKDKARKYYETTLKINPENMEALKELEELIPDFTSAQKLAQAEPSVVEEPTVEKPAAETPPVEEEREVVEEPEAMVEEPHAVDLESVIEPPKFKEPEPQEITLETPAREEEPIGLEAIPEVPPTAIEEKEPQVVSIESIVEELPEKKEEVEAVPLEALDKPVSRLMDLDSVKNVFISTKDGLLIKNYGSSHDDDMEAICASVAAICMDVDESFRLLKRGGLERCIIEKADQTLCVMAVGDSLLTVVTMVEAKPGLIFVYARKIIEEIEEILG